MRLVSHTLEVEVGANENRLSLRTISGHVTVVMRERFYRVDHERGREVLRPITVEAVRDMIQWAAMDHQRCISAYAQAQADCLLRMVNGEEEPEDESHP